MDHIFDNYDRSRDYALWKNVHWQMTQPDGSTNRVVWIDQNSVMASQRFDKKQKNRFYGLCR